MTRRALAFRGGRMQKPPFQLLLFLLFVIQSCPTPTVIAFPASDHPSRSHVGGNNVSNSSEASNSKPFVESEEHSTSPGDITEYPVFIPESEQSSSNNNVSSSLNPESEVVTETFMVIEDQETDEDESPDYYNSGTSEGDTSFSTENPAYFKSTLPMQPRSSPEQEEVLRELKKLWDISEGMGNDVALKMSLSSIVHLAYARIYVEPDETLYKLKTMLRKLTESLNHENVATTEENMLSSSSSLPPLMSSSSTQSNSNFHTTFSSTSPANMVTTTTPMLQSTPDNSDLTNQKEIKSESSAKRKKRSYYDDFQEIENIFFANVNSQENSVMPDEKEYYEHQNQNQTGYSNRIEGNRLSEINNIFRLNLLLKNNTIINGMGRDPLDRIILSSSSTTTIATSSLPASLTSATTPSPATVVQKVIHINDRRKPSPSFFLSPERIKELKRKMTTTPMPGIFISNDLENEVNSLQSQEHFDNFDIHISENVSLPPLMTSTLQSPPSFSKKTTTATTTTSTSTEKIKTTTKNPFTPEEIAVALFQLLKPYDDSEEDESGTPRPAPSNILYQAGPLSSIFNKSGIIKKYETKTKPILEIKIPNVIDIKVDRKKFKNSTLLAPPAAFANLGNPVSTSSTQSEEIEKPDKETYDYMADEPSEISHPPPPPLLATDGVLLGIQHIFDAISSLSVSAKLVLLFSTFISVLSIGFGLYALGPPLAGVGVLGIIIPVGLLFLFETSARTPNAGKKRKLTRERQQEILQKIEEFSNILDSIFEGTFKYNSTKTE